MSEQTCSKCGVEKPLSDFHANPTTKSGRQSQCKPCHNETARESARKRAGKSKCPCGHTTKADDIYCPKCGERAVIQISPAKQRRADVKKAMDTFKAEFPAEHSTDEIADSFFRMYDEILRILK